MERTWRTNLLVFGALLLTSRRSIGEERIIQEVRIEGSRSVAEETYLFHIQSKPGDPYVRTKAIADYHRLWNTGFLDDLTLEGEVLTFVVTERPRIERVEFIGSEALDPGSIEEKLREQEAEILVGSFYDIAQAVKAAKVIRVLLVDRATPKGMSRSKRRPAKRGWWLHSTCGRRTRSESGISDSKGRRPSPSGGSPRTGRTFRRPRFCCSSEPTWGGLRLGFNILCEAFHPNWSAESRSFATIPIPADTKGGP